MVLLERQMRETKIHAGCYKTATSSIQLLCNRHRDLLLERAGVLFPKTGLRLNLGSAHPDSKAHHGYVHQIRSKLEGGKNNGSALADKLREEAASVECSTILLSTELLSCTSKELKQSFIEQFCNFADDIKVQYAVRAADDYAESINNQMLKNGNFQNSFPQSLPYEKDIAEWRELVGHGNVEIIYFSKRNAPEFIARYFRRLGVDPQAASIDTNIHDNPPISRKGYLLRKAAFRFAKKRKLISDYRSRVRFFVTLAKIESSMEPGPRLVTLNRPERLRILEQSEAEMRRIASWLSVEDREALLEELKPDRLCGAPEKNLNETVPLSPNELYLVMVAISNLLVGKNQTPRSSFPLPPQG